MRASRISTEVCTFFRRQAGVTRNNAKYDEYGRTVLHRGLCYVLATEPVPMLWTGGGSDGGLARYRVSGGDHIHGAPRPGVGRSLPDVAVQAALDSAPGYHHTVQRTLRHIPVLR